VVVRGDLAAVAEAVGEQRLVAVDLSLDRLRVRVQEQLRRVAAVAVRGVVRPVHAVAVARAGALAGQVDVPDVRVDLLDVDAGLGAVVVEEAELDALGDLGEEGEVGPRAVVRGAERVGVAWPGLHVPEDFTGPRSVSSQDAFRGETPFPDDVAEKVCQALMMARPAPCSSSHPRSPEVDGRAGGRGTW